MLGAAVAARTRGSCRWVYQDEWVQRPASGDFGPGLVGRTPPQKTPLARGGVSLDHADLMSSGSWYSLHGEAPWRGRSGPRDLMDVRANFGSATSNAGQLASDDDGASMRRPGLPWSDCPIRIPTARGPRGHRRRCRRCWFPPVRWPGSASAARCRGVSALPLSRQSGLSAPRAQCWIWIDGPAQGSSGGPGLARDGCGVAWGTERAIRGAESTARGGASLCLHRTRGAVPRTWHDVFHVKRSLRGGGQSARGSRASLGFT